VVFSCSVLRDYEVAVPCLLLPCLSGVPANYIPPPRGGSYAQIGYKVYHDPGPKQRDKRLFLQITSGFISPCVLELVPHDADLNLMEFTLNDSERDSHALEDSGL